MGDISMELSMAIPIDGMHVAYLAVGWLYRPYLPRCKNGGCFMMNLRVGSPIQTSFACCFSKRLAVVRYQHHMHILDFRPTAEASSQDN